MKSADPEVIRRLRKGDIQTLLRHRYGPVLPDDDAGREDLVELLKIVSLHPVSPGLRMRNSVETMAPWMSADEAEQVIDRVQRLPECERKLKAAEIGRRLNVTNAERERLRVWTIAPVDMTAEELAGQRKAKDRARKAARRRARGGKSRKAYLAAALSKQKPWEREGVCRRTWERHRQKHMAQVRPHSSRPPVASPSQ